jgi:hypothetical protein
MERASTQLVAVTEAIPSSNVLNDAPSSSQKPRAHLMSKVLKRLKNKKWRKRRSRTVADALSDCGGQSTFSESDSVTSSMLEGSLIMEEERDQIQQEEKVRPIVELASEEESSDSVAALATLEQSASSITVTSLTPSTYLCNGATTTTAALALRGDLDDWRELVTKPKIQTILFSFLNSA